MSITPEQARAELARRRQERESNMGITPEEARAELARRRAQKEESQEEGYGNYAKRLAARTAKNVAAGVAGIADLPTMPVRAALNLAAEKMGYDTRFRPAQEIVNEEIDELTGGYTKPKNKQERISDAMAQEVYALPFGYSAAKSLGKAAAKYLSPAAAKVAEFGKKMYQPNVANIGGTAGATGGAHYYMDENENPSFIGTLGASMLGGGAGSLLGGGAGKMLSQSPRKNFRQAVGKISQFSPEKYEKYVREGNLPASLGALSEGTGAGRLESILAHTPLASSVIKKHKEGLSRALTKNLGFYEHELHDIPEIQHKYLARKGVENLQSKKSSEYERIMSPAAVFQKRSRESGVDVSDLIDSLKEEGKGIRSTAAKREFEKLPSGALLKDLNKSVLENSEYKSAAKELKQKGFNDAQITSMLGEIPANISYADLDVFRGKLLREKLDAPHGSNERRLASKLYNELSKKKHKFIEQYGTPEEVAASKNARKMWQDYANEDIKHRTGKERGLKNYVDSIMGTTNETEAFNKLLSRDPKYLEAVSQGLDKGDKKLLLQSLLSNMGSRQGVLSPNSLYTSFKSKDGGIKRQIVNLFDSDKDKKNFLNVMDFIGENKKLMGEVENTSRTAYTHHNIDMWKKAAQALTGIPGAAAAGSAAALLGSMSSLMGTAALLGGGRWLARLMTDPVFLERMNKAITAKNARAQNNFYNLALKSPSVKEMMHSTAYRSLMQTEKANEAERRRPLKVTIRP